MNKPDYLISTPENVDLHLELAGLGNRIYAAFLDQLIIWILLLVTVFICIFAAVTIENVPADRDTKTIMYYYLVGFCLFAIFVINFGYYIYFEGAWQGQTPGKKFANIRVIEANGQPVTWASVFIRNLLRLVDQGLMFIGVLPMMIDKNERRFGDLAAGTLVVRERLQALTTTNLKITAANPSDSFVDIGQISPDEYQMLLTYLKRRQMMAAEERPKLAKKLADYFYEKLNVVAAEAEAPEQFLEKLYLAYMSRAELTAE